MRLIDADRVLSSRRINSSFWLEIEAMINDTPTINAIEVVRCKDCRYRYEEDCPMYYIEWYTIDEGDGFIDDNYREYDYTTDEGYCYRGERREDGEL